MILDATVAGRTIRVEVRGGDGRYRLTLDGTPLEVDLSGGPRGLASLLVGGESHEVGIEKRDGGYTLAFPGESFTVTTPLFNATLPTTPLWPVTQRSPPPSKAQVLRFA